VISDKEAFDRIVRPDVAVDPVLKKALRYLDDRLSKLEFAVGPALNPGTPAPTAEEVKAWPGKISSESEQSSAKTTDGPATVSPKPARRTGSRSKRSAGGSTARSDTS
jgi:hypothetical protein